MRSEHHPLIIDIHVSKWGLGDSSCCFGTGGDVGAEIAVSESQDSVVLVVC